MEEAADDADDQRLLDGDSEAALLTADTPFILDEFGEEMTAVLTPVSICMALTAVFVLWFNGGREPAVTIALYYNEAASDTTTTRVRGAVVNALIYVLVVAAMTCVIWLLFRYRYTRVIWGILGVSGVNIFMFMGGQFWLKVLQVANVPLDGFTFAILLWNFSVVGVLATFFLPLPLRLKQAYLIFIGVVTALWFTHLPAMTTWALLILMALYDIAAVLSPAGPLRAIVELAEERDEDIPALVYESRPLRRGRFEPADEDAAHDEPRSADDPPAAEEPQQLREIPLAVFDTAAGGGFRERSPGASRRPASPASGSDVEAAAAAEGNTSGAAPLPAQPASVCSSDAERSVKLGLGDFIFYSLLVGRAAMTDTLTAAACYIGIVAGLGATLTALAAVHHALPALPISIALGVLLYVVARWVLEPFVVTLSTNLVYLLAAPARAGLFDGLFGKPADKPAKPGKPGKPAKPGKPISGSCKTCQNKGGVTCSGCKGSGKNKSNGNPFERYKCYDCQGFGLVPCKACGRGGRGLTPEQTGER